MFVRQKKSSNPECPLRRYPQAQGDDGLTLERFLVAMENCIRCNTRPTDNSKGTKQKKKKCVEAPIYVYSWRTEGGNLEEE